MSRRLDKAITLAVVLTLALLAGKFMHALWTNEDARLEADARAREWCREQGGLPLPVAGEKMQRCEFPPAAVGAEKP